VFDSRRRLGIFLFAQVSRTPLGPIQLPIQWVLGAVSLGVKRPGREADHSSPSSAEVNNAWSYTSTPPYVFMAWYLVKHRDNFTFHLLSIKRCNHRVKTLDQRSFQESRRLGLEESLSNRFRNRMEKPDTYRTKNRHRRQHRCLL
jgi:hypothetical protein